MSATDLAAFVNRVACTASKGGRCSAVDHSRCVLYDYGNWTSELHDLVRLHYHTCSITVTPFESSISGFIVIFDLRPPNHRMRDTFLVICLVAALCVLTAYASRVVADSIDLWPRFMRS